MTRYVLDAPTLLHVVREGVSVAPDHHLVAPNSVRSAALGLLYAEVRAGRLTDQEALALHTALTELKMRLLGDRVSRATAWKIARELDLETIDLAEYLAVTRLQADALVTVDDDLRVLARDVVPVASIEELTHS